MELGTCPPCLFMLAHTTYLCIQNRKAGQLIWSELQSETLSQKPKPNQTQTNKIETSMMDLPSKASSPWVPGLDFNVWLSLLLWWGRQRAGHSHSRVVFWEGCKIQNLESVNWGGGGSLSEEGQCGATSFPSFSSQSSTRVWFPSQEKHKCSGEKEKRIKAVRNSPANIDLLELKR